MSGTISLLPDIRWSAAGWLFDWTIRALADHVDDQAIAAELREVVDENLGWVSLETFPAPARSQLVRVLAEQIVPRAEAALPHTVPDRAAAIDHLRALSELAGRLPP